MNGIASGRCPQREQLAQFLDGRLPAVARDTIANHISRCKQCQFALDEVESSCDWPLIDLSSQRLPIAFLNEQGLGELEANARRIQVTDGKPPNVNLPLRDEYDPDMPAQIGQYRILEKLGQGGMGTVYRALHVNLKREVALKLLPSHLTSSPGHLARFYREMEAVGRIENPYVVRASDAGLADGWHFLVMEYAPGIDLQRLIKADGPLAITDACEIIRQAALGLAAIDKHGLVHRDIKPSNLLLTRSGQVKILDLGLARLLAADSDGELTGSEHTLGTAAYMAPEQIGGSRNVDIRADIYSLGCTFYALLTGQPPFSGEKYASPQAKMVAHLHDEPPAIQSLRPDIPSELAAVISRTMAKSPSDRLATPLEVVAGVSPFVARSGIKNIDFTKVRPHVNSPKSAPTSSFPTEGDASTRATAELSTAHPRARRASRSTLGAPTTWRPTRFLIGSVALIFVTAAVVAIRSPQLLFPRADADTEPKALVGSINLDAVPPLLWQPLLRAEPIPLFWPAGDGLSSIDYRLPMEQVALSCNDVGLIQLGSTTSPHFRIQFGLHQTRWEGGVGVFFGLRETQVSGKSRWRYQLIHFQRQKVDDPKAGHVAIRSNGTITFDPQGKRQFSTDDFSGESLDPLSGEVMVELFVEDGLLRRVSVGGVELPNLVDTKLTTHLTAADSQGIFGVFLMRSSCLVRNTQFRRELSNR